MDLGRRSLDDQRPGRITRQEEWLIVLVDQVTIIGTELERVHGDPVGLLSRDV